MTDEAKALVEGEVFFKNGKIVSADDVYLDPRDALIETQAREIERLRDRLEYAVKELSSYRAKYMVGTSAPLGDSHD